MLRSARLRVCPPLAHWSPSRRALERREVPLYHLQVHQDPRRPQSKVWQYARHTPFLVVSNYHYNVKWRLTLCRDGQLLSRGSDVWCLGEKPYPHFVLASCPGLLTSTFVACSTNTGKGLVRVVICSDVHVPGRWVDVWRNGFRVLCSCRAGFWTWGTSPRLPDVHCSVPPRSVVAISSMLTVLSCAFPRLCHSST